MKTLFCSFRIICIPSSHFVLERTFQFSVLQKVLSRCLVIFSQCPLSITLFPTFPIFTFNAQCTGAPIVVLSRQSRMFDTPVFWRQPLVSAMMIVAFTIRPASGCKQRHVQRHNVYIVSQCIGRMPLHSSRGAEIFHVKFHTTQKTNKACHDCLS